MANIEQFPTKADRTAIKKANGELTAVRITFTECEEYRVNIIGGRERTAYHTSAIDDAIGTAKLMDAETLKAGR